MLSKTHQPTRDFELALCAYTAAPYAVAVNSCTMALTLAVGWWLRNQRSYHRIEHEVALNDYRTEIEIPRRTYVSVPMSIIHAGGRPTFRDEGWLGWYQLKPLPVWDSARYFSSNMYREDGIPGRHEYIGGMLCLSFHASKTLGDTQGGAILLDDPEAYEWLKRARFDGRTEGVAPKDDKFDMVGYHCYMSPDVAARLLLKLSVLPQHNAPLPNDDYPDLSQMEIFK